MLTTKKFKANLSAIRKADETFRALIAESLAFAIFHARNHGQKTPFMQLQEAVPGWLQKDLAKVALAKLPKTAPMTEREAEMQADAMVAVWFASHAERKALNNEKRAVKKAQEATVSAPQSTNAAPEGVDTSDDVIVPCAPSLRMPNGDCFLLDADDADALYAILMQRWARKDSFTVAVRTGTNG